MVRNLKSASRKKRTSNQPAGHNPAQRPDAEPWEPVNPPSPIAPVDLWTPDGQEAIIVLIDLEARGFRFTLDSIAPQVAINVAGGYDGEELAAGDRDNLRKHREAIRYVLHVRETASRFFPTGEGQA